MVEDRCVQEMHVDVSCVKEFRVNILLVKEVCVEVRCVKVCVCAREGVVCESAVGERVVWDRSGCKSALCTSVCQRIARGTEVCKKVL